MTRSNVIALLVALMDSARKAGKETIFLRLQNNRLEILLWPNEPFHVVGCGDNETLVSSYPLIVVNNIQQDFGRVSTGEYDFSADAVDSVEAAEALLAEIEQGLGSALLFSSLPDNL